MCLHSRDQVGGSGEAESVDGENPGQIEQFLDCVAGRAERGDLS